MDEAAGAVAAASSLVAGASDTLNSLTTNKAALKGLTDELAIATAQEDVALAARERVGEILAQFTSGNLEGSATDLANESNQKVTEAKEAFEDVKTARNNGNINKRAVI